MQQHLPDDMIANDRGYTRDQLAIRKLTSVVAKLLLHSCENTGPYAASYNQELKEVIELTEPKKRNMIAVPSHWEVEQYDGMFRAWGPGDGFVVFHGGPWRRVDDLSGLNYPHPAGSVIKMDFYELEG